MIFLMEGERVNRSALVQTQGARTPIGMRRNLEIIYCPKRHQACLEDTLNILQRCFKNALKMLGGWSKDVRNTLQGCFISSSRMDKVVNRIPED